MSLQQRLTFITLGVKDLQRVKDFYITQFGWKTEHDSEGIVMFRLNGFLLSLFSIDALAEDAGVPNDSGRFKGLTLGYNVGSIAEVDALFTGFAAKEVKVVKAPEKAFWGGYRGYIADPEGNLWEIAWNPYMELDAQGSVLSHE
jgi:catechol 2,3-dioxygenase-like lactoylglutathione lyase family enzyme